MNMYSRINGLEFGWDAMHNLGDRCGLVLPSRWLVSLTSRPTYTTFGRYTDGQVEPRAMDTTAGVTGPSRANNHGKVASGDVTRRAPPRCSRTLQLGQFKPRHFRPKYLSSSTNCLRTTAFPHNLHNDQHNLLRVAYSRLEIIDYRLWRHEKHTFGFPFLGS